MDMTLRCCYLPSNFNFPRINSQQELNAFTFCCLILTGNTWPDIFSSKNFVEGATFVMTENHSGFGVLRALSSCRSHYSVSFSLKMWIYFPRWSYNPAREKRPYPSLMTGNPRVSGFLRFEAILQGCQM